jgi:predicted DNA-binding transcriptional regulator AlpA
MSSLPLPALSPTPGPADPVEALRDRPEAGRRTAPVAAVEPLLVPAAEAARLCGVSEATWWRLHAAAKVPRPTKLGNRTLWATGTLRDFVALNCPPRKEFEAILAARQGQGGRR